MLRNRTSAILVAISAALAAPSHAFAQTEEVPKTAAAETAAPAAGGEEAYNNACRTCHSVKSGDNRLGPSLAGIVGKKAGSESGYQYSPSLKDSGVTFDEATLDKFITNPDSVAPGNNMKPYTGISDAAHRAKIIAFLKSAK
jgi:cytochrome c